MSDEKITLEIPLHKYKEAVGLFGKVKTNISRFAVNQVLKGSVIEDVNRIMTILQKGEKHNI